jgi:hypothetical protein
MLIVIMLSILMLNVIMLSVVVLNVITLNVISLNVIIQNVFSLNVIMLSVVVPLFHSACKLLIRATEKFSLSKKILWMDNSNQVVPTKTWVGPIKTFSLRPSVQDSNPVFTTLHLPCNLRLRPIS